MPGVGLLAMRWVLALLAGLLAALSGPAAAADLLLHPTRIVFDKNRRTAQVEMINNGTRTMTYRITAINRRMNETGDFSDANPPLPGERFADEMLRFAPRQVVLAPGASQTVRIQLRKPAELAEGEYRSHLLFTQVADGQPAASAAASAPAQGGEGLEIKLTPLLGVSIPVIVRHGATSAKVRLGPPRIERPDPAQPPLLALELHREGNRSVYGDLVVLLTPPGGAERALARANGVAVYVPNPLRRVRIALPDAGAELRGALRVVYQERPEDGGQTIAEIRHELR